MSDEVQLVVTADTSSLPAAAKAMDEVGQHATSLAHTLQATLGRIANLGGSSYGFDLTPTFTKNIGVVEELRHRLEQLHGAYQQAAAAGKPLQEPYQVAVRRETRTVHDEADARLVQRGQQLGMPQSQLTALRQTQSQAILQSGAGVGRELQTQLVREFSGVFANARQMFGQSGSLKEISPTKGFLAEVEPEIRQFASSMVELARENVLAAQAQRALTAANEVAAARAKAEPATAAGGAGGKKPPPTPPPAAAAPPPPEKPDPTILPPSKDVQKAEEERQRTEEERRRRFRRVEGGPTAAQLREQQTEFFNEGLASGRLRNLGGGLAVDEQNQRFHSRTEGPLSIERNAELLDVAQKRYEKALRDGTTSLDNTLREMNQRTYRAGIASGQIQPLGGARSPLGYERTTDSLIHRDLGPLNEGLSAGDPERAEAFAQAQAALTELRRLQAADAQKSITSSQRLSDAQIQAAQQITRTVNDAREAARQATELSRQQGRINAGDPFISERGRYLIDKAGDQPTVQRRVGAEGLIDLPSDSAEAMRVLGAEARHDAEALRKQAEAAERAALYQDVIRRRLDPNDTTLHPAGRNIFEDNTPGQQQRLIEINPRQGTARVLSQSEADLARATQRATVERNQAATAESHLKQVTEDQARRGLLTNFLGGISSAGFGGSGGFNGSFDGLARSAGQAAKYSALYQVMGLLSQSVAAASAEFLDMDDSVTELEVAMKTTSGVTADFQNQLQDFAAIGGFNVGEAMDVAASGIRAFHEEVAASGGDLNTFGESFAKQAGRLAVLSKTTLTDSAGNLKAIASGFNLEPTDVGLSRVTDAVAGAKLAGGGDETQIFQGLANSALIFKELGFSLNETATIISKINAQTDQSGTLIASRLSRLGQIIGGSTGKNLIGSLNEQLTPEQRVDTGAPIRDQILKLSQVYGTLSEAQRQTVNSGLGGTANARELIILLSQMKGIVTETQDGFAGEGAKEFEKRLSNVRAQLTEIQGNVKAIITNLAASGLAAPFVGAIQVIKPITDALREISQVVFAITSGFGNLISRVRGLVAPVVAVGLALKAVAAVNAAGGLRAFAAQAEARFAPGRGLARDQLAERASNAALVATARRPERAITSLAEAQQNLAAARSGRPVTGSDLAVETRVASGRLGVAAAELHAATGRLAVAEREFAAALGRAAIERRAGGVTGPTERRLQQAEEGVTQARLARSSATQGVTRAEGRLRNTEAAQARDEKVTQEYEARRNALAEKRAKAEDKLTTKIEAAATRGDSTRARRLEDQLLLERAEFNQQLVLIDREELAARKLAARNALRTGGEVFADRATFGLAGRYRAVRDEGGTRTAGARAVGAGLAGGIATGVRTGGSLLADFLGGPVGIALAGLFAAGSLIGARREVGTAQDNAETAAAKAVGLSTQDLRDASESNKAAAANLRELTSGFSVTHLSDLLGGGRAGRQADASQALGERQLNQANALAALQDRSVTATSTEQLAAGIDTTDANSIGQSLQNMITSGQKASDVMDALTLSISKLEFASAASADKLTDVERLRIAVDVGNETEKEVDNRRRAAAEAAFAAAREAQNPGSGAFEGLSADAQQYVKRYNELNNPIGEHAGPPAADTVGSLAADAYNQLKTVDPENLRKVTEDTTREFLGSNKEDLNSKIVQEHYRDLLLANYATAKIPAEVALGFARDATIHFNAGIQALAEKLSDPKEIANFITNVPAIANQVGTQAQASSQLNALRTGTQDNSAQVGIAAQRASLDKNFAVAKTAIGKAVDTKKLDSGVGEVYLNILQTERDKAEVAAIQNVISNANRDIGILERQKRKSLYGVTDTAKITAITAKYNALEFTDALATNDIDTIIKAIENSDKATVDAERKAVHAAVIKAQKQYDDLLRINRLTGENLDTGPAKAALEAATTAANAFDAADSQAVAGTTNKLPNANQIRGAQIQAYAARTRDNIRGLQGGVVSAKGNLDAVFADGTKTEQDRADALKAYYEAVNALNDGMNAVKNAVAGISAFPATAVTTAKNAIRDANRTLATYAKESIEYNQALDAKAKGERDLAHALIDQAALYTSVGADLTDPVVQARIAANTAAQKLADDRKRLAAHPNDQNARDAVAQDTVDNKTKQAELEAAQFNKNLQAAQTADQLGRISHAAYLQYLQHEHDRLSAIKNRTYQQQQELDQVDQAMQSAAKTLSGQFNIGDIKIPTVYEVRRAVQNSLGANSINATTSTAVTTNNISINGADLAAVEAVLKRYLGAGDRYTTQPRRG